MKKIFWLTVLALSACSASGLLPVTSGDGTTASIPRVIVNCQTTHCRTNAAAPLVSVAITTSSCNDPLFGAVVSSSTRSTACTSTAGCYVEMQNWTSQAGSTATLPSGVYNVCGCVNYTGSGQPWDTCNSLGSIQNTTIGNGSGLQMISAWVDQ